MSILMTLIIVWLSSMFCTVFVLWPSQGLNGLHLPQWMGLALIGLLLSWLIGE
ncbi:MAG: hypothetical protein KA714_24405 [Limnoraphis sp. WC205]|jgi:hypothetical protein|nr:hypothetical protein [Limnoraphis sp. WC205]